MWRPLGIARDAVGPTPQQHCSPGVVPAKGVGQADSKLGQPLPQVALGVRSRLPGGLQHLVGVERTTLVQQPLGFGQSIARRQGQIFGDTGNSGVSTSKRPAKGIARAGVARPAELVAFPIRHMAEPATRAMPCRQTARRNRER